MMVSIKQEENLMKHENFKKRLLAAAIMLALIVGSITPAFAATDIAINKSSVTITSGKTYQLKVTVNGASAKATWKSSKTSVATVDSAGLVTGKAAGSAVITASAGGKSVECLVSVLKKTTSSTYRYNVLILDASGSMKGTPNSGQKLAAKRFCQKVLSTSGNNYVAVIALNSSPKTLCSFTNNFSTLEKHINSITPNGDTNINQALALSKKLLDKVSKSGTTVMKNVVLCSDGLPTKGTSITSGRYKANDHSGYSYANAAYNTATKIKKQNYFIYALGFFHNLSGKDLTFGKRLMKDLASEDKYYIIQNSSNLSNVFNDIANQITQTTMNKTSLTLTAGSTYQLRALVNGVSKAASWKSSSSSIASVNSSGKVTAKKAGTATITATVNGTSVTCKVTVKPVLKLSPTSLNVYVGKTQKITATTKGTSGSIAWTSSSPTVAGISSSGVVTGKKPGAATITAKVNGVSATCKVTVLKNKFPNNAFTWNGHTYAIINTSLSWTEASQKCKEAGGHLVTVTSQAESDMLSKKVLDNGKKLYWIGLYRDQVGTTWKWVNGEKVFYTNWTTNEPNNDQSKGECYVHLFAVKYTGGVGTKYVGEWNDAINIGASYASSFYSLSNFGYICEWDYV